VRTHTTSPTAPHALRHLERYAVFLAVAQVGDVIAASDGNRTITDLGVYDPLAKAEGVTTGGDHWAAFWASTDTGDIVVRATYHGFVSP
jgi:hypothetical protein